MTETVYIKRSEDSLESFLMNQKDYSELAALYPKLHAAIIENGQKYVNHVFEPAPQKMTLENAKDEVGKKYGYKDWNELRYNAENWPDYERLKPMGVYYSEAAELYMQSNLSKLIEENEELKTQMLLSYESNESLGNQVKTLREALEEISQVKTDSDQTGVALVACVGRAKTALSTK